MSDSDKPLVNSCLPYTLPFTLGPYDHWAIHRTFFAARADEARASCSRADCYDPTFNRLVERLRQTGALTKVQWKKRVEGERDGETGHPAITWVDAWADVIILQSRGVNAVQTKGGVHIEDTQKVYTLNPLQNLDRLVFPRVGHKDFFGKADSQFEYEVGGIQLVWNGESAVYYTCTLTRLDLP